MGLILFLSLIIAILAAILIISGIVLVILTGFNKIRDSRYINYGIMFAFYGVILLMIYGALIINS